MTVLLVDDQKAFHSLHQQAFGRDADCVSSVAELEQRLRQGAQYSCAFVDFQLRPGEPTGLSAMTLLHRERPTTRLIAHTTIGEAGRTLYVVAAHRWFGAQVLDKNDSDVHTLTAAARGADPTPSGWTENFHDNAHLIDTLFAQPTWAAIWRVWWYCRDQEAVVATLGYPHTKYTVRVFSERASGACENFQAAFMGQRHRTLPSAVGRERGNAARSSPLSSFAHRHAAFFEAADLDTCLEQAQPWKRYSTPERPSINRRDRKNPKTDPSDGR